MARPIRAAALRLILVTCIPIMLATGRPAAAQYPPPDDQSARELVTASAENMGGLDRLRDLRTVALTARGHEFVLGAFETSDGPQPVEYDDIVELRDYVARARSLEKTVTLAESPQGRTTTVTVRDSVASMSLPMPDGSTRNAPGRPMMVDDARKSMALSPERILLTALDAPDLAIQSDSTIARVPVRHLSFTWSRYDVDLFLEASTLLIHRVRTTTTSEPDFSWRMWPEVTERTTYYYWAVDESGLRYPRQWDIARNGIPYRSVLVTDIDLSMDAPAEAIELAPGIRDAFASANSGMPPRSTSEIAPGIEAVSGMFRALVVRQGDRVIAVEAPVWSDETGDILSVADTLFPGARLAAGVIGAGAITQYGGAAAFEQIDGPIYGSAVHQELIGQIAPRLDYRPVVAPVEVGSGPNRFTLYPALGDHGRSTLLLWFPEHRLLYGSSLLIPERFSPLHHEQRLFEVQQVIERHGLDVDRVFGMYLPPVNWTAYSAIDD